MSNGGLIALQRDLGGGASNHGVSKKRDSGLSVGLAHLGCVLVERHVRVILCCCLDGLLQL